MTMPGVDRWRVPIDIPGALTKSPLKAFHYSQECYFREAWRDLEEGDVSRHRALERLTFVLFKPDGLVAHSVSRTLGALRRHDFVPIAHSRVQFDRLMIRELWRFELNLATLSRLDTIDRLLTVSPSLLVLLRDDSRTPGTAAERLSALKGPSLLHLRKDFHLRHAIGARDGLLNFIHTPDEPADVVRELGVLLDREQRRQLLSGPKSREGLEGEAFWHALPSHDLELEPAVGRIRSALAAHAGTPEARIIMEACETARQGHALDSAPVVDAFSSLRPAIECWDEIVLLVAITDCNLQGIRPFLSMPTAVPDHA